jgi:hypothetical protein
MAVRDFFAMPPIGSKKTDADGLAAVRAWILALQ